MNITPRTSEVSSGSAVTYDGKKIFCNFVMYLYFILCDNAIDPRKALHDLFLQMFSKPIASQIHITAVVKVFVSIDIDVVALTVECSFRKWLRSVRI